MKKFGCFDNSQSGSAMITALGVLLVMYIFAMGALTISASQMNVSTQEKKGNQAFNVAEAGLNKAIWKYNNSVSYGPTASAPDTGTVREGTFEIYVSAGSASNQKIITVTSYSPNKTSAKVKRRRIQATVMVTPQILSYGMFTGGWVDGSGSATAYYPPLDYTAAGARGTDIGSNSQINIQDQGLDVNPAGATFNGYFGTGTGYPVPTGNIVLAGPSASMSSNKGSIVNKATLTAYASKWNMNDVVILANPMTYPTFDFDSASSSSLKSMAAANTANGALNSPTGHNGVYTYAEFNTIMTNNANLVLTGPIYVDASTNSMTVSKNVTINNGYLCIKSNNAVTNSGGISIAHSTALSKTYPGLVLYSAAGNLSSMTGRGTATIDGLVYGEKTFDFTRATFTVKGCLLVVGVTNVASVIMKNGTVILQYDPNVMSTIGFSSTGSQQLTKVLSWREVPAQ